MLPQAQLRGTFDQSEKRSRLGDCVMLRQIARSFKWPYCDANTQMGIRNFWPYHDPMKGGIGAPSHCMVFVEKQSRSTPTREFRRRCFEKIPAAHPKPDIGAH